MQRTIRMNCRPNHVHGAYPPLMLCLLLLPLHLFSSLSLRLALYSPSHEFHYSIYSPPALKLWQINCEYSLYVRVSLSSSPCYRSDARSPDQFTRRLQLHCLSFSGRRCCLSSFICFCLCGHAALRPSSRADTFRHHKRHSRTRTFVAAAKSTPVSVPRCSSFSFW